MDIGKLADMVEVFEGLEDWRNAQQTRHRLSELLAALGQYERRRMSRPASLAGHLPRVRAGDVLGALTKDAGLPADQVGKINVNEFSTYVAVARAAAKQALAALNDRPVKGKRVKARLLA